MKNFLLLLSLTVAFSSCCREKHFDCPKDYCGMRVVDFGDKDYTLEKSCGEYITVDFTYADQKYFIGDTIGKLTASEKNHLYIENLYKQLESIK